VDPERDVDAFWAWFAEHGARIGDDPSDARLLDEIGRRISRLDCPGWEIGPGQQSEWFLALSPERDPAAYPRMQRIVGRAPSVPGWTFLPHRPKKDWYLQFEIEGDAGPIEIDARGWRFVAYRYPDGMYDIVVRVDNYDALTVEDRALAVQIAVEGHLGEEALLTRLNELEAAREFSPTDAAKSRKLASLRHLPQGPDAHGG